MKPILSSRTNQKTARDAMYYLIAALAWAIDGNTTHITGSLNLPPETMGALLIVLLYAHRFIRKKLGREPTDTPPDSPAFSSRNV